MMDNKLTLVLFLRGREAFTLRWLEYMDTIRCPFRILIADGSKDEFIAQHMGTAKYPNLHYEYHRFPYDKTLHDYYIKAHAAIGKIETEFVVFVDNDDFMSMEGLFDQIQFLNDNSDYVSCGGPTVFFEKCGDGDSVASCDVLFSQGGAGSVNEAEEPMERVLAGILGYDCYLWYNVVRTKAVKEVFSLLKDLDPKCMFISEYLYVSMIPLFGKTTRNCKCSYYRQLGTSQADTNSNINYNTFFIITDEHWSAEYTQAHEMVHGRFSDKVNLGYEDYLQSVREAFACLLNSLATPSSTPFYTSIGTRLGLRDTWVWSVGRKVYSRFVHVCRERARLQNSNGIIKSDAVARTIVDFMKKNSEWSSYD